MGSVSAGREFMAGVASVFAHGDEVLCENCVDVVDCESDCGHCVLRLLGRFPAEPPPGHVHEGLGVCGHGVAYGRPSVLVSLSSSVFSE